MSEAAAPLCPVVLAAPSGTGKTTIARTLVEGSDRFVFSVSATTRPKREHEVEGVDYRFISAEAFDAMRARDEFIEWAEVHGHLYGTPRRALDRAAAEGHQVVLDIDVQGARQLRQRVPEALLIFVLPPSAQALVARLRGRRTEDESELLRRLRNARDELAAAIDFDYVIVNHTVDEAVRVVKAIASGRSGGVLPGEEMIEDIASLQHDIDGLIQREFTRGAD